MRVRRLSDGFLLEGQSEGEINTLHDFLFMLTEATFNVKLSETIQSEIDRMASKPDKPDEIAHALALSKSMQEKQFQYIEEQRARARVVERLSSKDRNLFAKMEAHQNRPQGT